MKIKFQLVLKRVVEPEHYLLNKLYPLVQAESSTLGDYDLETVRSWIEVDYFTAYDAVPGRKLLGFTVYVPDELAERGRELIDAPPDKACFATDLQKDTETVEIALRYEDDFILADLKKYHPEIFEIEMKLREVLNYILAYNLPKNEMIDFLKEFEGAELANKQMNGNKDMQQKRYKSYFENELFHLVFSKYSVVHGDKQKQPKAEDVLKKIQQVNTFEELKQSFYNITFSEIESGHGSLLNTIKGYFGPIETMRNEIMHTRKPSIENEQEYQKAKDGLLDAIAGFWGNERSKTPSIESKMLYLLDAVMDEGSFEFLKGGTVRFQDLDSDEKEMSVEEFKEFIREQISKSQSYELTEEEENALYERIDIHLNRNESKDDV